MEVTTVQNTVNKLTEFYKQYLSDGITLTNLNHSIAQIGPFFWRKIRAKIKTLYHNDYQNDYHKIFSVHLTLLFIETCVIFKIKLVAR